MGRHRRRRGRDQDEADGHRLGLVAVGVPGEKRQRVLAVGERAAVDRCQERRRDREASCRSSAPSTSATGDWSIWAWNETIGLAAVMLPVMVSSDVMLSSAEAPVSSARRAVMTGGVRLRPGWVRVRIRVNWLLTPAAFVAIDGEGVVAVGQRHVEEGEQAVGVRLRDGPGLLEGHRDVGIGLADQGHGGVRRHAVADGCGIGVDVEVEDRPRGRRGRHGRRWSRGSRSRRPGCNWSWCVDLAVAVDVGGQAVTGASRPSCPAPRRAGRCRCHRRCRRR